MENYRHRVYYYETDRMGITHHSNYIRFMEEARMDYLSKIGYPMSRIEEEGITSPVVSVNCEYKRPTTFDDIIEIAIKVDGYTGVSLNLSYTMRNAADGELVAVGSSRHCFVNEKGRPISLKKSSPALHDILCAQLAESSL